MIAALYVQTGGVYFGLPNVDPWDVHRDARKYQGPWPVVAHPPCARWCQLASLVEARYPHIKRGADGGTFKAALESVRRWGGVLEHPAFTAAWPAYGLHEPTGHGWQRTIDGGWVCQVSQAAYGHRARKLTWLYFVGSGAPVELNWKRAKSTATMTWLRNHGGMVERMGKKERNSTPLAFRDVLISLAELAQRRVAA